MAEQLETTPKEKLIRAVTLASGMQLKPDSYEFDDSFKPANLDNINEVHTTAEMVAFLERHPEVTLDAKVLGRTSEGVTRFQSLERNAFVESFKKGSTAKGATLREGFDPFLSDESSGGGSGSLVGNDFTPYLGGPFYKNQYFYQDYIRMHSQAFYAFHHDPVAKAIVNITTDFTLGRGFRVDSKLQGALALWKAFEQVNDLQQLMRYFAQELCVYGEDMVWWLPNNETKITYNLRQGDKVPHGVLPRVKLVDPSNIVEIVTYPEDMTRQLFYVWLAPTQYQIYTGATGGDPTKVQPSLKFIYRQIPADQMLHFKINTASNEKRGRSDLFPVLGYLKRLRDIVAYGMVRELKQSAWCIDTEIDGSQTDIDAYVQAQTDLGTVANAGSEFVHSTKVKRQFLGNAAGAQADSAVWEWCMSMIAAGVQIPTSYFGMHHGGSQTRASAIVGTEPVAKKFEMRQSIYETMIRKLWDRLMTEFGLEEAVGECEVTFPEILTQDRSAKLKDLALAETQRWISPSRAAEIASKELGITNFDYTDELPEIKAEMTTVPAPMDAQPLTAPGAVEPPANSNMDSQDKRKLNMSYGK